MSGFDLRVQFLETLPVCSLRTLQPASGPESLLRILTGAESVLQHSHEWRKKQEDMND